MTGCLGVGVAAGAALPPSALFHPLISFVGSPSWFSRTTTFATSGIPFSSSLDLGLRTPTAWQIAESSRFAISTAVTFGFLRLSRAQRLRFA